MLIAKFGSKAMQKHWVLNLCLVSHKRLYDKNSIDLMSRALHVHVCIYIMYSLGITMPYI